MSELQDALQSTLSTQIMNQPKKMQISDILSYFQQPKIVEGLSQWEKGFVESLSAQFADRGNLSERQVATLQKVYHKYSPEKLKDELSFKKEFGQGGEVYELWNHAIQYYEENPPYFASLVSKVRQNKDYIPTKELFEKLTSNKFFQKWYDLKKAPAIFSVGDLVMVSGQRPNKTFINKAANKLEEENCGFSFWSSIYSGQKWYQAKTQKHLFLIQEVCDYTFTLSTGSKLYRAIDISGEGGTLYLEQRMIKEVKNV